MENQNASVAPGLLIFGLIALAAGLWLGLSGLDGNCGSAFAPNRFNDGYCSGAVSDRRPWAFGVTGLGAVLLVFGLVMYQPSSKRPSAE